MYWCLPKKLDSPQLIQEKRKLLLKMLSPILSCNQLEDKDPKILDSIFVKIKTHLVQNSIQKTIEMTISMMDDSMFNSILNRDCFHLHSFKPTDIPFIGVIKDHFSNAMEVIRDIEKLSIEEANDQLDKIILSNHDLSLNPMALYQYRKNDIIIIKQSKISKLIPSYVKEVSRITSEQLEIEDSKFFKPLDGIEVDESALDLFESLELFEEMYPDMPSEDDWVE